ncbi:excalibur calcium-binding domain-containing protein [Arthrobacter sp. HY1533]|uniref:excalibur calcium-binding domain-containing protein n=1 Tax=Arthrobacter sp. HY1533 TaxID=2970919 RepID=UPI0022B9DD7C|nr:excalibur calcium-binding domain-containing protein [Arthrobacter sp. HY1533]
MTNTFSAGTSKAGRRPKKSFWITAGIWLLLLILMLVSGVAGAFGAWLVLFALFLIVTALYSLVFGRRSWLGLPHRKGAGAAVGAGFAALVLGFVATAAADPAPSTMVPLAETKVVATVTATPSPSPTPTPKSRLLDECASEGTSFVEPGGTLNCTKNDKGVLVWMTEKDSKTLLAERAEVTRVAQEKAVAEKAAAEKAAAEKAAAEQAAAVQAAADEAARVAAEKAAQQQAPPIQPLLEAPAGDVYYANCSEAKAAGAAPLYIGQPGYRPKMDGDSDGIACER